jgi:hypothetical protein
LYKPFLFTTKAIVMKSVRFNYEPGSGSPKGEEKSERSETGNASHSSETDKSESIADESLMSNDMDGGGGLGSGFAGGDPDMDSGDMGPTGDKSDMPE